MAKIVVIGAGVVGLCSAWYLQQAGHDVVVLEKGDFTDNCSFGNAGYVCPSHFVPLAAPGMVAKGLKWMWNNQSPFYIEPRPDWNLITWAWHFLRSANASHVAASAIPLRDIALLSQACYREIAAAGLDFSYEEKGLLEVFQTEAALHHATHLVEKAQHLGLDANLLSREEIIHLEPHVRWNMKGGIKFGCDGHLYPPKLMQALQNDLRIKGVQLLGNQQVTGFVRNGNKVSAVLTTNDSFLADKVVVAAGSWSMGLAKSIGFTMPLVGGRGYSVTLTDAPFKFVHPVILVEGRTAITPMDGNKLRFGGTMEITALDKAPRINRMKGIAKAVQTFLPEVHIPIPNPSDVWYGYRPVSPDGLPYIGCAKEGANVIFATGHAMVGLSLGAGTGKLVQELVDEKKPSMPLHSFDIHRFG